MIRRECFFVSITDDDLYENTESFTILLALDSFFLQSGVRVDPPVTEIFIIDNDGKFIHNYYDLAVSYIMYTIIF